MNLHGIVSGYIAAVNPQVIGTISKSTGYTTAPNGKRTPTYAPPVSVAIQIQALQYNDLVQLDGLNIEGERRAMYINGNWEGVVRADKSGGDIITLPDGSTWIVALVLEDWGFADGWVKVAATRQNP